MSPGRRILVPVALAASITSLDTTVVTVSAPSIRADLGLTLSQLEWVATSYVLTFAGFLLVGGRLADLAGRRRTLQAGMALFAVASVVVAAAPDGGWLLAGRALQGTAAGVVVPSLLAVLAGDVEERDRHLGAGVFAAAAAGALALGPLVGGAISQYVHWTWIFWINLPIVAVTMLSVRWALPDSRPAPVRRGTWLPRLDLPGLLLSTLALSAVTFALIEGQKLGAGSPVVWSAVAVAVAAGCGAVAAERRARFPLFDPEVVRHRVVVGGTAVQILWGLGINGVFFFTSLFLQDVLEFSPTTAGLTFMPLAIALVLVVPVSAWLAAHWGTHRTIAAGMVVVAAGLTTVAFVGPGDGLPQLLPGLLLIGVGTALTTPIASAMLGVVPAERAGVVSATVSVAREISGVLGIAVTGAVLTVRQTYELRAGATPDAAFLSGYRTGLLAGAALSVVGAVLAWRLMDARRAAPRAAETVLIDLREDDYTKGQTRIEAEITHTSR